jgi:hypothetical protein
VPTGNPECRKGHALPSFLQTGSGDGRIMPHSFAVASSIISQTMNFFNLD